VIFLANHFEIDKQNIGLSAKFLHVRETDLTLCLIWNSQDLTAISTQPCHLALRTSVIYFICLDKHNIIIISKINKQLQPKQLPYAIDHVAHFNPGLKVFEPRAHQSWFNRSLSVPFFSGGSTNLSGG
jgi:hypothetical protein